MHTTPMALGWAALVLVLSACTSGESQPESVDPGSANVGEWSRSVLGDHDGMLLAGDHEGGNDSRGAFQNVKAGWYQLTMACAGGGNMALSITADDEPVGDGTTGCDAPAVNAHIQVMADAGELEFVVSNSGEHILWTVGLEEASEPSPVPTG